MAELNELNLGHIFKSETGTQEKYDALTVEEQQSYDLFIVVVDE